MALLAEGRSRGAERAGHDEEVARSRAGAAGHPLRATERGHRKEEPLRAGRVAAQDRHTRLVEALVELDDVVERGPRWRAEADDQALGLCARGGQVAEVDGRRAVAEVAVARPLQADVHLVDTHAV